MALILFLSVSVMFLQLGRRPLPHPVTAALEWFAPLAIVNSYGLFANMTTTRHEIVIEGSRDGEAWSEYAFRYKPGDTDRRPPWNIPHQPRLDWQMWFAALASLIGGALDTPAASPLLRAVPIAVLRRPGFYALPVGHFAAEAGFLAVFLPSRSVLVVWLFRWLLFRFVFGSGWVKLLSGDPTWASFTALDYHYETQPLPTPIAWYAHQLPPWFQHACTFAVLGVGTCQ